MSQTSQVEQAIGRFETALHKLEAAMAQIHDKEARLATTQGEAEALRAEQKKLVKELDEVRGKAQELADINRQVATRVDSAMKRVKKVLS